MIDRLTIDKIMDATNIVDVVSEFVTLKKTGVNYKGLCPFHDDKTPSFIVSPSKGICHCFACGKGGNSINFLMEHEQMTYPDALRWLAKKYNIEIKERELTAEEQQAATERESMFIINNWALGYFHDILHNDTDGRAIGMQYFRSRGFRDDIIEKFQLGFAPSRRNALSQAALKEGYKAEYLVKTGLCYKRDDGELVDRYAGRVIFPWLTVSGKVNAFGGRVLDSRTKGVQQKYVNSPESEIYHKDHELYGLYQAKRAIAKEDTVYMVEGYTDVLAFHQAGIENVVANSGTALTQLQVMLLARFCKTVTLIYDSDEAGLRATLRAIPMLLKAGMSVQILRLPKGEDPDSFVHNTTPVNVQQTLDNSEQNFLNFMHSALVKDVTDPDLRSSGVKEMLKVIAVIPSSITQESYLQECSRVTEYSVEALKREFSVIR